MKKKYETPVVENLVFDYTDVVAASGNVTSQSASECTIMPNGRMMETGATCQKDPDRTKNKKC